ncbi:MAG: hypothetical protein PGMFKBFP_03248 [Anaerolineales bacterium]|nr:hypothetical protein [Anaerolineales bacterium]
MSLEIALILIRRNIEKKESLLDLSALELTKLPDELWELTHLKTLYLYGNKLEKLSPKIGQLQNLAGLYLYDNRLAALPSEIGRLQNLTNLSLFANQLIVLPPEIGRLQNLAQLNLFKNQLTTLPPEIGRLQNLTKLTFSVNQLTVLPPEIGQLQNLIELDLWSNHLTMLPPEIGGLQNLTKLDLRYNHLTALPPEIGQLRNLVELSLRSNRLTALPPEIAKLYKLKKIQLRNNPLEIAIPAKWLEKDEDSYSEFTQKILAYYRQTAADARSLGEERVLVVGEADGGKTKLLRALLLDEYSANFKETREPTDGIEINDFEKDGLRLRFWDFGGQEIMHATHRFFLSRRCVYLLVLDSTRDRAHNQAKAEYWLELIKYYGEGAPVLMIASKSEHFSLDINKNELQEKYPNLIPGPVLATSAKTGKGIEELCQAVWEHASHLPSVNVLLARNFITVKEEIEKHKDNRKAEVIEERDYRALCEKHGITEDERQDVLLQLLHDMGVILHYDDERLRDFGILNPEWATAGVYKLVNHPRIKEARGKFTLAQVKELINDEAAYPSALRRLLVDLMRKFELIYELPLQRDIFILPNALSYEQPDLSDWGAEAMSFEYEYNILRDSVLHRFIVRKHEWIENGQLWYSGVIVAHEGNQALIRADFKERKIRIRVRGEKETRKDFLYLIRTEFESLHSEGAQPQEFIYPPQYPDLRLPFDDMKVLAKTDREYRTVYQGRSVSVNLRELLDGFVTPEERMKDTEKEMRESGGRNEGMSVNINLRDLQGGNIVIGKGNQITQTITDNFNAFPPQLRNKLVELMSAAEAMMSQAQDEEIKEEIQENLDDLQKQGKKSAPNVDKIKVSVEGLKKAAENLKDIGKPVLELAAAVIKLLVMS